MTSVVFMYEGETRWVGPGNLGMTSEKFDESFQGTFLYRANGAAAVDAYFQRKDPTASVVRKKSSLLNGKTESVRALLDAKTPLDPARNIQTGKGSFSAINDVAPMDFFWGWYWVEWGDLSRRNYAFQGWEEVDGRACLCFQIDRGGDEEFRKKNHQRLWVDVERNAHLVRFENHAGGKLTIRNDISLFKLNDENGKPCWLTARGHIKWYVWEGKTYDNPITEQITAVITGSARVNIDLPDSLFTVRRDAALPAAGELEKLKAVSDSSALRREFEAQPASEPFRTDPASVRKRIDRNLAEADRQSRELEASSPARASWSWTTVIQAALVMLGIVLLSGVSYRKWSRG